MQKMPRSRLASSGQVRNGFASGLGSFFECTLSVGEAPRPF